MSISDNYTQETPLDDPDTNNATYIGWSDWSNDDCWPADCGSQQKNRKKRFYYQELDRYNGGLQSGPKWQNKRYQSYWLHREEVFSLGSRLEMDDWVQRRASRLLTSETRSELGVETNLVLISLCGYVLHDSPTGRECHPQTNEENFDERVDRMLDELNIRRTDYDKTYRKIQRIDSRGEQTRAEVRDRYEMDVNSKQVWREVNSEKGDGWL